MKLSGRGISRGSAEGKVVKVEDRVSFLGDVDPDMGLVFGKKDISNSIFVFPGGKGSTVGSYVIYQLKKNGTSPKGIINKRSETIVASGAIISDIPLVDEIDIDLIEEGDQIKVDGNKGEIELKGIQEIEVVTAFLKRNHSVLLLKRSDEVKTYQERWAGISGYLETEETLDQAKIEIEEETGLKGKLLAKGKTVHARDDDKIWKVHPFLFEVEGEPTLDWENQEYEWVNPDKIKERKTVPKLWEAYISVRDAYEDKSRR